MPIPSIVVLICSPSSFIDRQMVALVAWMNCQEIGNPYNDFGKVNFGTMPRKCAAAQHLAPKNNNAAGTVGTVAAALCAGWMPLVSIRG
jgi:hypothetical protein